MKVTLVLTIHADPECTTGEFDATFGHSFEAFREAMKPVGLVTLTEKRGELPPARVGRYAKINPEARRLHLITQEGDDDLDT
jgi:hypothetical protein